MVGLLFLFVSLTLAQTDFVLPPTVKSVNAHYEGLLALVGNEGKEVATTGTFLYKNTDSAVVNHVTFSYTLDGAQITSYSIARIVPSANVKIYQVSGGACDTISNSNPRNCSDWVPSGKALLQKCKFQSASGKDTIATSTEVTLTSDNQLSSVQYSLIINGGTTAAFLFYVVNNSAVPPDDSNFVPPALCNPSTDPFDPSTCPGPSFPLAKKFPPGARAVQLVNYTLTYQQRDCTALTGCGPWASSTPSWTNGPSPHGTVWLRVASTTQIIVVIVASGASSEYPIPVYDLGANCTTSGDKYDCGSYRVLECNMNWCSSNTPKYVRFGGNGKYDSGVTLPLAGFIKEHCSVFTGSVRGPEYAGAWIEYRGGFYAPY